MTELNFKKLNGLIPVVTQDFKSNKVLMLAFMNKEAWEKTLETRKATYYSRSKDRLWTKGEESGNFQLVKEVLIDCDEDTVLLKVEQKGNASCHKGYESCFFRKLEKGKIKIVDKKVFNPEEVYKK